MGDQERLVQKHYLDLYADYYGTAAETAEKREIAAEQTMGYLTGMVGNFRFDKLLDVGAGDGNVLSQLDRRAIAGELYALEISTSGIQAIKDRQLPAVKDTRLFDGYHIPYPDKYFDLAVAIHVLEHVEHERLLLREMRRVARRVYVEVPLEHGIAVRVPSRTEGRSGTSTSTRPPRYGTSSSHPASKSRAAGWPPPRCAMSSMCRALSRDS